MTRKGPQVSFDSNDYNFEPNHYLYVSSIKMFGELLYPQDPMYGIFTHIYHKINHSCTVIKYQSHGSYGIVDPGENLEVPPFHVNKNLPPTTTFENKEVLEQPSRNVPWQRPRPVHEGQRLQGMGRCGFLWNHGWLEPPANAV